MRIILHLSCCLILLASCNRYQYVTINSRNLTMNDKQEFVAENDTLRLIYNFNGKDAPIHLTIANKLNVPVYIDWRQSSLIVNDKAISYVPHYMSVTGEINTYNTGSSYTAATSTIDAAVALPASVDFIPPHSFINKNPMGITNRSVALGSSFRRVKVLSVDGEYYYVKTATFSDTASPIRFRSYLTIMVGEAAGKPVVYEHAFYVSELMTTGLQPQQFSANYRNKGNRYYVKETTGFGRAARGFGVIAGTAVIVGAAAAINPYKNCGDCQY